MLMLLLSAAFLLRLFYLLSYHYISPDGTQYAALAYNLAHYFSYVSNAGQFPDIIQPPLYPLLTAPFTLVLPAELAGKIVSLCFGLLLVYAVYRFSFFIKADKKLAFFSGWIVALHPGLISVSAQVVTESLYLFLLFTGFALGWVALKKKRIKSFIMLSVIWTLVFFTRPEGLVFFMAYFFLISVLVWFRKFPAKTLIAFLLPFLSGLMLLALVNFHTLGYITFSPKISFVNAQAKLFRFYQKNNKTKIKNLNPQALRHQALFSLAPDKKTLAADALLFKKMAAPQIDKPHGRAKKFSRFLLYNLINVLRKLKNGLTLPAGFLLLLLAGLYRLKFREQRRLILYGLYMSAAVFGFILSHVEDRFLFALIPFTAVLMGRGLLIFYIWLKKIFLRYGRKRFGGLALSMLCAVLLFVASLPAYGRAAEKMAAKSYYYKAGLQLKKITLPASKVAAVVPQAVFFADLKYAVLPYASLKDLLLYLRKNKIRYILWEEKDQQMLPQFTKFIRQPQPNFEQSKFSVGRHQFYLLKLKTLN